MRQRMKKWLLLAGLLPFLGACTSVPDPLDPEDCLVIGYFALDFPDGFFDQPKRTITSGVTMNFTNETTGNKFWLITSRGYFQFLSNGKDWYTIDSFKIETADGSIESAWNRKFAPKPHSVFYLGHLTLFYAEPKRTYKTSMGQRMVYWDFKTSSNLVYNEGELRSYLQNKGARSPWLEYAVVR
jgi:hypothetical protein